MFGKKISYASLVVILFLAFSSVALAQTSEFTYQGKLNESSVAANGTYDLSFKLYDGSGTLIGSAVLRNDVQITDGFFAVSLDFGSGSFDGTNRFLEIAVRPGASTGSYTTLSPMQPVTSAPYAVKSLKATTADTATNATTAATATNATQLGGMTASQFVQTGDPRMTDARTPLPNSANYIQNTTNTQTSSDFNISGNGTVGGTLSGNTVDSATQYNIAGQRMFWAVGSSVMAGPGAGASTPAASNFNNTFIGNSAGAATSASAFNTFVGNQAGFNNTSSQNSFFGHAAGMQNVSGFQNSFFGTRAGGAGSSPAITGGQNSLFGYHTGWALAGGSGNTLIGANADVGNAGISNGTAIGTGAIVSQNNTVVLGATGVKVGIGTSTPVNKLQIIDGFNTGLRVQNTIPGGTVASFGANGDFNVDSSFGAGGRLNIKEDGTMTVSGATNVIGQTVISGCPTCWAGLVPDKLVVDGTERLGVLASGGATALCRNSNLQISSCSSSLRYKTGIEAYRPGLDLIKQLQPISFRWKADGMPDLGLGAETVAKVEPLLVTNNDSGEVEGVKYDRVAVVLVNAVKEQQALIEKQQQQIDVLRREVGSLTRAVSSRRKRK